MKILLPIGLSFHTFQSLSYVIEVYKNNSTAEKNFITYALYVMFFPQLVAGPIERPQHLLFQFNRPHIFSKQNLLEGFNLALWGIVIADGLSSFVTVSYADPNSSNAITLVIATFFFAFQIYFDFSGYSDIALGTAKILGFDLMINFNRPYFSHSVSLFWRNWHCSLSSWFKDYVYIPLGGNRSHGIMATFNLLFTFFLSGLWHGANTTFIVWGILNGLYLIAAQFFSKYFNRINIPIEAKLLKTIFVFLLISVSWIFFRATSINDAFIIVSKIFNHKNYRELNLPEISQINYIAIFSLLFAFALEFKSLPGKELCYIANKSKSLSFLTYNLICILILYTLTSKSNDNLNFIYFQF